MSLKKKKSKHVYVEWCSTNTNLHYIRQLPGQQKGRERLKIHGHSSDQQCIRLGILDILYKKRELLYFSWWIFVIEWCKRMKKFYVTKDLELESNYYNLKICLSKKKRIKIKLKDISWTINFDGALSLDGLEWRSVA